MTAAPRLTLADAKAKLDVATLWQVLSLPGKPGRSCRCPLHEDRNASFSVFIGQKGGLRWKCHSHCGQGGPVELLARVLDITEREACRRIIELAGGNTLPVPGAPRRFALPKPPQPRPLRLPVGMHPGTHVELRAVADRRQLSFAGVELASTRGLLWFGQSCGFPSWIITDGARINAQSRRMDGVLFPEIGDLPERKAHTLGGSRAPWPIGMRESKPFPFVVVVEGAPDLLAAHHRIVEEARESDVAAVAILGGANLIPDDALTLFAGKRVRLFPHADAAGRDSAVRWSGQLERAGCTVDAFRFDGLRQMDSQPVKDLNDFASLHPDCLKAEGNELTEVIPR